MFSFSPEEVGDYVSAPEETWGRATARGPVSPPLLGARAALTGCPSLPTCFAPPPPSMRTRPAVWRTAS